MRTRVSGGTLETKISNMIGSCFGMFWRQACYRDAGIRRLRQWQADCLSSPEAPRCHPTKDNINSAESPRIDFAGSFLIGFERKVLDLRSGLTFLKFSTELTCNKQPKGSTDKCRKVLGFRGNSLVCLFQ